MPGMREESLRTVQVGLEIVLDGGLKESLGRAKRAAGRRCPEIPNY